MRISELIQLLEAAQKEHGDIDVVIEDKHDEPEGNLPVKNVIFDEMEFKLFNKKELLIATN